MFQECTAEQLSALHENLKFERYDPPDSLINSKIVEDLGKYGSLAKIRALYPDTTLDTFFIEGCMYKSLSGAHMPLYIDDVLAWCHSNGNANISAELQNIMLALQQCRLNVQEVLRAMNKVQHKNSLEASMQATRHVVNVIIDMSMTKALDRSQELADQFIFLSKGWDIQYPVALMVQRMQKHDTLFSIPPVQMLDYPNAEMDVRMAGVFQHPELCSNDGKDCKLIAQARLMQALCESKECQEFCIQGYGSQNLQNNVAIAIEGDLLEI